MQTKLNLPKTIPYLPGQQFQVPAGEKHHKIQQLSLINGIPQEKTNYISEPLDPYLIDSMKTSAPLNLTYGKRQKPENDFIPRIQPPWLKYDRKVLKFTCYFQEAVVENPIENYRVRQCEIYFYLSDGTIFVKEPRQENSGIPQGKFIKQQKIPKKIGCTDAYYTWEDFNIGININFFERIFRIVDADEFTKEFYSYMGVPLSKSEPMPVDNYEKFKELKEVKINPPDTKEYKEYNEVKLRGGHPNDGLNQYINNDRKVLSFSIVWDDTTLEGGSNYYTLNYFLADSTVEVKEIRRHNSGKDPYALMLSRKKLPKKPILTHYPGMTLKKEEFYQAEDLLCGGFVNIHSKECLLYNCDEFTYHWYLQNLGVEQKPAQLKEQEGSKLYQKVPPYNGYGSEEDSLQNVYALQPKAPRKDVNKMYSQDQFVLRFDARLLSETKDDNSRTFIISFFCGDDTIQVYEVADKNSGIWKGKFLERTKHKNPNTGNYIQEQEFQIGNTVKLGAYRFQLLRADEFTHKYFKSKPNVFQEADISTVLQRLKDQSRKYPTFNDYLVDLLRKLDKNNNGVIQFDELCGGLAQLGFNLTYQEAYTLMRHFDKDGNWLLDMKELFEGLGGGK